MLFNVCLLQDIFKYHYPYRAFGGQNKIVYSTRFVIWRAILLILPGQYYNNIARALCDQSFKVLLTTQ